MYMIDDGKENITYTYIDEHGKEHTIELASAEEIDYLSINNGKSGLGALTGFDTGLLNEKLEAMGLEVGEFGNGVWRWLFGEGFSGLGLNGKEVTSGSGLKIDVTDLFIKSIYDSKTKGESIFGLGMDDNGLSKVVDDFTYSVYDKLLSEGRIGYSEDYKNIVRDATGKDPNEAFSDFLFGNDNRRFADMTATRDGIDKYMTYDEYKANFFVTFENQKETVERYQCTKPFDNETPNITGVLGQNWGYWADADSHNGTDYAANFGDNIYGLFSGNVIFSGYWGDDMGNYVKTQVDMEYEFLGQTFVDSFFIGDAHFSTIDVLQGDVQGGTLLGGAGESGLAEGVHLHRQIWSEGYVSPILMSLGPDQSWLQNDYSFTRPSEPNRIYYISPWIEYNWGQPAGYY